MDRQVSFPDKPTPAPGKAHLTVESRLVSVAFDDSWSMLDEEVALIDRLFGGEIAALFERHDNGGGNVRR